MLVHYLVPMPPMHDLLLNLMFLPHLKYTPLFSLTGSTNDISMLLYFYLWQPVYFRLGESDGFPSESKESYGHLLSLLRM